MVDSFSPRLDDRLPKAQLLKASFAAQLPLRSAWLWALALVLRGDAASWLALLALEGKCCTCWERLFSPKLRGAPRCCACVPEETEGA